MPNLITGAPPFFQCSRCKDGVVSTECSDGRFFEHPGTPGVWTNLPPDLPLQRCNECRYVFMSPERRDEVLALVQSMLAEHATMINLLAAKYQLDIAENRERITE